jgi:hypothetical protein
MITPNDSTQLLNSHQEAAPWGLSPQRVDTETFCDTSVSYPYALLLRNAEEKIRQRVRRGAVGGRRGV